MTPERFRQLADNAFADASDYRAEAEAEPKVDRRELLLRWAESRHSHAAFYLSRAEILEHSKVMQ